MAARPNSHASIARIVRLGIDLLGSFAQGRADIPLDRIDLIVKWIWNDGIEYNAEADALMPTPKPEPRSIGTPPEFQFHASINGDALPKFTLDPPPRGPQPEVARPKPKQPRGWIGGVWE